LTKQSEPKPIGAKQSVPIGDKTNQTHFAFLHVCARRTPVSNTNPTGRINQLGSSRIAGCKRRAMAHQRLYFFKLQANSPMKSVSLFLE
jgi:hypothetical protein